MANYLYNGMAFPALPAEPMGQYMTIMACPVYGYRLWCGAGKLTIKNGDTLYLGTNARFHYYAPENGEWVYKSYIFTDAGLAELVWANHDIINQADGSVYLAGSDPVLPEQPVITGVALNQTAVSLKRGGTFQFSATVSGAGSYDASVTYTLSGNSPNGGTTLSAAGLLTIGENETSPAVTVTATSVQDSAFSQSAAVTVKDFISKLAAAVPQAEVLFDGTVTTEEADGGFAGALFQTDAAFSAGDVLQVTFSGETYTGAAVEIDEMPVFGGLNDTGPDFTNIPVLIACVEGYGLLVATETPGTYSLKAERLGGVAATSATVSFTCSDLLSTDSVYRIKAWVYEPTGYSYNGVILPELPEEPIGQYMGIMTCPVYGYRLWCGDSKFRIKDGDTLYLANNARFHYYAPENGAWVYKSYIFTDAGLQELVWANHDVVDFADSSLYLAASDPVRDDLDTTLPPAWTSDLFAGPSHSEAHTFSGLLPTTDYGVYSVITTGDTATEHHATVTFTTAEGTAEPVLVLSANQVTDRGFNLYITRQGLEAGRAYTAEINVYDASGVGLYFETVMTVTGDGIDYCAVTGISAETACTAEVYIYPTDGGEVVLFGELAVTTGASTGFDRGFAGVEDVARRLRAAGREKGGTAQMLTVFFGDRNGLAQSL